MNVYPKKDPDLSSTLINDVILRETEKNQGIEDIQTDQVRANLP